VQANPTLVEQTRGPLVENRHRGAFVVIDSAGTIVAAAGDIERPVFPRSAIKSMQALALFSSGATERFALTDEDLALACASHHGEDHHLEGVRRLLERVGVTPGDLECGAHQPTNAAARAKLRADGGAPTPLHNNCSGKHAGMLAVARALDVPVAGYVQPDHPVQREVRQALEAVLQQPLEAGHRGTDGCSIPTWAASLRSFAHGFARMATGEGLPDELAAAAIRTLDAAVAHPQLVAGTGHFDTEVMQAFGGRMMQKGGAEGVPCGAIRDRGWGYALKIDDGNMVASIALAAALLLRFGEPDEEQAAVLQRFARQPIRNVRGLDVGELRAVAPDA
jgi:L-asparaginase II